MKNSEHFKGNVSELLTIDTNPPLMVSLDFTFRLPELGQESLPGQLAFRPLSVSTTDLPRNTRVLNNARQLPIQTMWKIGTIVSV